MRKRKQLEITALASKFEGQKLTADAAQKLKGGNDGTTPPPDPEDPNNIITDDIIDQ